MIRSTLTTVCAVIAGLALLLPAGASRAEGADDKKPKVVMETSMGQIVLELDAEKAPISTANFLEYVDSKRYDGTIFHRVIETFMIQGGGFRADMSRVPTESPIKNESGNGLRNDKYSIAMARTRELDSATNQFFINTADNGSLDRGKYAVFGKVVGGRRTVDKIAKVAVKSDPRGIPGETSTPVETIVIETVRRVQDPAADQAKGAEKGKGEAAK